MATQEQILELASALGWAETKRDELHHHGEDIVWYCEGEADEIGFQINTNPSLRAAVFSFEHDLYTGWILIPEDFSLAEQVERLTPYLAKSHFETEEGRESFRRDRPECAHLTRQNYYAVHDIDSQVWERADDRDRVSPDWQLPPEPPIHRAARRGDLDELARLLEEGADINQRANLEYDHGTHLNQLTTLMVAARSIDGASVETLRWLVEQGADINVRSKGNNTAAWYAAGHGGRLAFHQMAVTPDHVERLRYLLDLGLDPHECNYSGRSLMTEACEAGDPARVQLLLDRGVTTDATASQRNRTHLPLCAAATSGSADCVRLLVAAGANPNARDGLDRSPLMQAGSAEVVTALIDAGADTTATHRGSDVVDEVLDCEDLTWTQMEQVVQALFAAGVPTTTDASGQSRLSSVAFRHHALAVEMLLGLGADPNGPGSTGTPLHSICWQGEYEDPETNTACERIIDQLIVAGADKEAAGQFGGRPLHTACGGDWGNQTAVRVLLRHGVEVDPLDESGNTPLYWAAMQGEQQCIRLLLAAGASPVHKNTRGETPIDAARAHVASWEQIVSEPPQVDTGFEEEVRREMAAEGIDLDAMDFPMESPEDRAAGHQQTLQKARDCLRMVEDAAEA